MKHTAEQLEIIEASTTSNSLVVNALAGTGKTSTALSCAKANAGTDIVYLCFNRANATEMSEKCARMGIRNVHPSTLHAMAYRASARPLLQGGRRIGSIKPYQLDGLCSLRDVDGNLIHDRKTLNRGWKLLIENLSDYCHSAARDFGAFRKLPMYKPRLWQLENLKIDIGLFQSATEDLWEALLENRSLDLPHDIYMKMFHLDLDIHIENMRHGMVIVDEAQDLFPVTEDIVKRMRDAGMRALFLGDRYQQIYSWNKSVNAMEHFEEGSDRLMLTQSFRCPANVVDEAQPWLRLLGFEKEFRPSPQARADASGSVIISRSNAGVFAAVVGLMRNGLSANEINLVGGAKGYTFDILEDRLHFIKGEFDRIKFAPMASLTDDDEYDAYAKSTKDVEMKQAKYYVDLLGSENVRKFLDLVRLDAFQEDKGRAKVSISTGHKVKGLEFANVVIADSFADILEEYGEFVAAQEEAGKISDPMADDGDMAAQEYAELGYPDAMKLNAEELRLAYVALTRSLKEVEPGNLGLRGGRGEIVASLIRSGAIVLVDRDQQGNVRLYGESGKKAGERDENARKSARARKRSRSADGE